MPILQPDRCVGEHRAHLVCQRTGKVPCVKINFDDKVVNQDLGDWKSALIICDRECAMLWQSISALRYSRHLRLSEIHPRRMHLGLCPAANFPAETTRAERWHPP